MKLTAELSLYPIDNNYLPAVVAFIDALHDARTGPDSGGIDELVVNQMSTQLCGDAAAVHGAIAAALARVAEAGYKVSLVAKYLTTALPLRTDVDLDSARGILAPAGR